MNAVRQSSTHPTNPTQKPARAITRPVQPIRNARRERDFGIGYGSSSGYADPERPYAANAAQGFFRCR